MLEVKEVTGVKVAIKRDHVISIQERWGNRSCIVTLSTGDRYEILMAYKDMLALVSPPAQ